MITVISNILDKIFNNFTIASSGSDILLLGGLIYKDGSVDILNSYLIHEGSATKLIPGDYSVNLFNADGDFIQQNVFHTGFELFAEPTIETEVAPLAFAIPFPTETESITIKHNDAVLIEINPLTQLLYDAIDSIPDHGFKKNPEQRRNALHNKVSEVEIKIEEGDITGAINKLEHDIKDKLEKWLLDDYEKETLLQISKMEIIDLVDDILERLSQMQ